MKLQKLASYFIQLVKFQIAPQDIPKNDQYLIVILILYFMLSAFTCQLYMNRDDVVSVALLDTGIMLLFTYVCLWICGFINRWSQTLTAVAGVGCTIGIIALPFMIVTHQITDNDAIKSFIGMIMLLLLIWNLMVNAHIFRHAFSVHYVGGIAISIMYFLLMNSLVLVITPEYLQS